MRNSLYFLIGVLLAACNQKESSECPESKQFIQFINLPDSTLVNWGNQWQADSLYMNIDTSYGFFPIDKNNVFLAGSFANSAFTMQSFLLQTTNGGDTWQEIMKPLQSVHIEKIVFINRNEGYLVGDWMTESTGEEFVIYSTIDGGENWEELPAFKKPHYTCVCADFLATKKELRLVIDCMGGTPIDGVYTFISSNHAKTWEEASFVSYTYSLDGPVPRNDSSASDITGFDQSTWKVLNGANHYLYILRQHNNTWDTVSSIPKVYHWKNGILSRGN